MTTPTTTVTLTSKDGVATTYKSVRSAAIATGIDYKKLRIAKLRSAKHIGGYAVKFS